MAEQQISIIIVEDEPEFRRRFVQIVENEPSMKLVGAASNKREAQAIIDRESFEVMLIDLGLPDGSGIELIRQVSQKKPDVDIMVVTVFGDEQHVVSVDRSRCHRLHFERLGAGRRYLVHSLIARGRLTSQSRRGAQRVARHSQPDEHHGAARLPGTEQNPLSAA